MKTNLSPSVKDARKDVVDFIIQEVLANHEHIWENPNFPLSTFDHVNVSTSNEYHGINKLYLTLSAMKQGFKDPRWMTYLQAQKAGYHIKKGSKSTRIEYAEQRPKKLLKVDPEGNPILDEKGKRIYEIQLDENNEPIKEWFVVSHNVFNASQIEGLEPIVFPPLNEDEKQLELQTILDHSEAPIHYKFEGKNYYSVNKDHIVLQEKNTFKSIHHLYATALHEIAHSTGHSSRLDRFNTKEANKENYAREELVAEFTSAMFMAKYDLPFSEAISKTSSAAYIQGWHSLIKDNPNELFIAVARADRAFQYIENNMLYHHKKEKQQENKKSSSLVVSSPKKDVTKGLER